MPNILIVGATRGLGASLTSQYASQSSTTVFATARSSKRPSSPSGDNITWIPSVDIATESAGTVINGGILPHAKSLDVIILTAGFFGLESYDKPNWEAEVKMYTTSAIAPVFVVRHLDNAGLLKEGTKIIIVSSESGSIALRHESEGGGNFGHHASKAASNMVGKLLSLDLKAKGVIVCNVHPGFMRTEMTAGVGFDKFWDAGGAVTPDQAAESLISFIEKDVDMSKSGTYWAPRGAADIGTAEDVLGPKDKLPVPLQLPW